MAKTATKAKNPPPAAKKDPPKPASRAVQTRPQNTQVSAPNEKLPAFMQQDVGMGTEHIGQSEMEIPRLKLMQGLSKELQLYDDLRPGHFFHTATEAIIDKPIRVVPVYADIQYILWRPRDDGGGIIARAADGVHWSPGHGEFEVKLDKKDGGHKVVWKLAKTVAESGLANWGTMNPSDPDSPPAATLMYNFLLAFPDDPELMPAVLTFQRSSIKMGRKLNTKLKTLRTPIFGSMFHLSAADDHNAANQDFKNINMTGAGFVEDEDLYNQYKDLHLSLRKTGFNIRDLNEMQDEGTDTGGAAPEGSPRY